MGFEEKLWGRAKNTVELKKPKKGLSSIATLWKEADIRGSVCITLQVDVIVVVLHRVFGSCSLRD